MLPLRIALRYLFSPKTHSAVNIISLISVAGIVVATAAIVIIMSVFNGFSRLAESKLSLLDADYSVTRADGRPIADADSLCALIGSNVGGVTLATPTISRKALAIIGDNQMPVTVTALSDADLRAIDLDSIIIDGTATLDINGWPCALLSPGAAIGLDTRNATCGELILYEPRRLGRVNPGNPMGAFRSDTLVTAGIYVTADAELDAEGIIVPLHTMRSLLEYSGGEADALRIYTDRHSVSTDRIAQLLPGQADQYIIADRIAQHAESYRMISVEKWMTFLLLAFVLVIASFNIISTMAMLIIEKSPNMHILRAMGATRRFTDRIFIYQSWLITVAGGIIGIIIGVIVSLAQQYGGFIKLQTSDPDIVIVDAYPVAVVPADLIYITLIIAAVALLTSAVTVRALHSR